MKFTISIDSGFSGVHMGLIFSNGTTHTDDAFLATRLQSKGYAVESEPDEADTEADDEAPAAPDLESFTIAQLKELAAAEGIDLGAAKTKAEIIAVISEAQE